MIKKRGGKRPNAGRKRVLSDDQRLNVGILVHRNLIAEVQKAFRLSIKMEGGEDLARLHDLLGKSKTKDGKDVVKIPAEERLLWDANWKAKHGSLPYDPALDGSEIGQHIYDSAAEISDGSLQGRRYFAAPRTATRDILEQVLRDVAQATSAYYAVKVTERMAKRCLDDYRKVMKAISESEV